MWTAVQYAGCGLSLAASTAIVLASRPKARAALLESASGKARIDAIALAAFLLAALAFATTASAQSTAPAIAATESSAIEPCDRLAASPYDPTRPPGANGVQFRDVNAEGAIEIGRAHV